MKVKRGRLSPLTGFLLLCSGLVVCADFLASITLIRLFRLSQTNAMNVQTLEARLRAWPQMLVK